MQQIILSNPVISMIVLAATVVAATWKVFDALYLKPRDYKINELEKHVEQMRREMLRAHEPTSVPTVKPVLAAPTASGVQPSAHNGNVSSTSASPAANDLEPMRSLAACFKAWRQENLTDLQVKHFEETYTGQSVSWDAYIESIDKTNYNITLYAEDLPDGKGSARVLAYFPLSQESRLRQFNTNEKVRLTGTIKKFFTCPTLEPVEIHKIEAEPQPVRV